MADVFYFNSSGDSRAISIAPYKGGVAAPNYLNNNLTTLISGTISNISTPLSSYFETGYVSCSADTSGTLWICGYTNNAYSYSSSGTETAYTLPANVIMSGITTSGTSPYFCDFSGNVYDLSSSTITKIGSFAHSNTTLLQTDGTDLYSLSPINNTLETYTISGGATSSLSISGLSIPAVMSMSPSGNFIAVGGWSNVSFANGYDQMVSNILSNGDNFVIGVNSSTNTIDYYETSALTSNDWSRHSSISGYSDPQYVAASPNGEYIFVSNPTSGICEVYTIVAQTLNSVASLSVSNSGTIIPTQNNAQALVLQNSSNTITPLIYTSGAWSTQSAISITNPSAGVSLSQTIAVVGTTNGFVTLSYNGSSWISLSTTALSYTPSYFTIDGYGNTIIMGTNSGTAYLSVFAGTSKIGEVSWSGSADYAMFIQNQLFVLDKTNGTLWGFDDLAKYVGTSVTLNSIVFTQMSSGSPTYSLIPKTYYTSLPTSPNGIVPTYFGAFLYGSSQIDQLRITSPFTFVPSIQSVVSIYNKTSWVSTTSFPTDDRITAVAFDDSNNVWAVFVSNTLAQIDSSTGAVLSSSVLSPYNTSQTGVPLGISAMVYANGHLYGSSCLMNGVLELF